MASALGASRSFVSHALARVRSGVVSQGTGEGPPIHVEPFDATNVSTPAALIKLGTSIAAARRQRANFAAAQQDAELAREGTREQIALLRAQAKYYEGTGRQSAGRAPAPTLSKGPYTGWTGPEANSDLANRRIGQTAASEADRNKRTGRVTAAQAGLKQIDAEVARKAEELTTGALAEFAPTFQAASAGDEKALTSLEIDPADYKAAYGTQKSTILAAARKRVHDDLVRLHTEKLSKDYQAQREKHQAIIDQGAQGFDSPDQGDPNNPLGLTSDENDNPAGLDPQLLGIGGP